MAAAITVILLVLWLFKGHQVNNRKWHAYTQTQTPALGGGGDEQLKYRHTSAISFSPVVSDINIHEIIRHPIAYAKQWSS